MKSQRSMISNLQVSTSLVVDGECSQWATIQPYTGLDCLKEHHQCNAEGATVAVWLKVMECTNKNRILLLSDEEVAVEVTCGMHAAELM